MSPLIHGVSFCIGGCSLSPRIKLQIHMQCLDEWNMKQLRQTKHWNTDLSKHASLLRKCNRESDAKTWWAHHFLLERDLSSLRKREDTWLAILRAIHRMLFLAAISRRKAFFSALYRTMLHISLRAKPSTTVAFNFEKKNYIQKHEAN